MDPAAYLALVVCLAAAAQWLAWAVRVPSILFLLVVGFGLGRWVSPDDVLGRDLLFAGVTLAVGVILFEGSLSLRLKDLREVGRPVRRLCSSTVLLAWALITAAAWLVGFDWRLALLVGALLVVTGPTVINPILRQVRPVRRVANLLRWEGIVVDPIGAILAVLVYQAVLVGGPHGPLRAAATSLATTIAVAVVLTAVLGFGLQAVLARHLVPDFLHPVLTLAAVVGSLVGSNLIQAESGLLTVTLLGLFLGNRAGKHLHGVQEFKEHLQVIFVGALFVMLAGRVEPSQISSIAPQAAIFVALLVLVVRPVSVLIGLAGTNATRPERVLLSAMAPRGIVAAAVTSIFALELDHDATEAVERADRALAEGSPQADALAASARRLAELSHDAENLVPLVFVTIVATVAIYGLGVGRLAERLGLAVSAPGGVLFAGAQGWVRDAAAALGRLNVPTLLVSQLVGNLSQARMAGLRTERTHVLSEYAVEEMDLAGIGSFIAVTSDDDLNGTAAREYAHTLGKAHVFQLLRTNASVPDAAPARAGGRVAVAERLSARAPFAPPLSYAALEERYERGMRVRSTRLTDKFTYADFTERQPDAVAMFLVRDGSAEVITQRTTIPATGVTLVAMSARREPDPAAAQAQSSSAGSGGHAARGSTAAPG